MDEDTDKIDEAVLGPLWLTLRDAKHAWKGMDWDALDRLYQRELIYDPKNKYKSVSFTLEGLAASQAAFEKLFAKPAAAVKSAPPWRRK